MKNSIKILAVIGVIATILVAGLAFALSTTPNNAQTNDQTPVVSINSQAPSQNSTTTATNDTNYTFTVTVGANVDGRNMPMADALVDIYSVNVTKTNTTTAIVLDKVACAQTDAKGVADFSLAEGKYLVIAHYDGLEGFGKINLTADESRIVMLHNWHYEFLNGLRGAKQITIQTEY